MPTSPFPAFVHYYSIHCDFIHIHEHLSLSNLLSLRKDILALFLQLCHGPGMKVLLANGKWIHLRIYEGRSRNNLDGLLSLINYSFLYVFCNSSLGDPPC